MEAIQDFLANLVPLLQVAAASLGTTALAAHQVVNTLWHTVTYGVDAFAIAAQALVGLRLGAGDVRGARAVLGRVVAWGVGGGVVVGVLAVLLRGPLSGAFTPDPAVQDAAGAALLVLALIAPIGAVAFQLDGVLIGAGDARFLALAGIATTLAYAPFVGAVWATSAGLAWLWAAYGAWLAFRSVVLGLRTRSDRWLRLGA